MSYDLKSLEFDKILSRLKQYAMSQQAKNKSTVFCRAVILMWFRLF